VSHPDFVLVSRATIAIGIDASNGDVPDELVYCDPLHITRIVPLRRAAKTGTKRDRKA